MTTMIILSVVVVAVLGLICGVILAVASKVMEVKEDERIGQVRELLPGGRGNPPQFSQDISHR